MSCNQSMGSFRDGPLSVPNLQIGDGPLGGS